MSAMAAAPPPAPRLDSVLSFSGGPAPDAPLPTLAFSDDGSDADFEFAFAPPLSPSEGASELAPADDLFAHGRLVPAYPVFDRHLLVPDQDASAASAPSSPHRQQASTAPPSPDMYCAWAPLSAPASPSREDAPSAAFPKSKSTGEARRFWRLRDLVAGGGGRSHSDGKEKFVFLHSSSPATPSKPSGDNKHAAAAAAAKASAPPQKQGKAKKKGGTGKAGAVTEMDMATAHRLFYGKPGAAGALAGDRPRQQQQSYLPYRPGIVGFFTAAHALGRSHHPY